MESGHLPVLVPQSLTSDVAKGCPVHSPFHSQACFRPEDFVRWGGDASRVERDGTHCDVWRLQALFRRMALRHLALIRRPLRFAVGGGIHTLDASIGPALPACITGGLVDQESVRSAVGRQVKVEAVSAFCLLVDLGEDFPCNLVWIRRGL